MTRRERLERKAERLRDWADKRDDKAVEAYERSREISDRIPFGQPILVGHHSERGHRRDIARIDSAMSASVENSAKADDMRSRAENIERAAKTSIYSDDVDAVEQLTAKIASLEAKRDAMKAANADYRKAHRAELKALDSAFARDRAVPFPGYAITNLGATIRAAQKRLAELSTPERPRTLTAKYRGECRSCGAETAPGDTIAYYRRSREVECATCAS